MSWFTRKPRPSPKSYVQAGAEVVGHLYKRLGMDGTPDQQAYTQEESKSISVFLNDFVAWGKQQAPPLFAVNPDGQIFCHRQIDASSLQGFTTSTALQHLYRSDAYKRRSAQERLATALHAWLAFMDSEVLRDMIPMLRELGWDDEVDRVSKVLHDFPPHDSNERFLRSCNSVISQ